MPLTPEQVRAQQQRGREQAQRWSQFFGGLFGAGQRPQSTQSTQTPQTPQAPQAPEQTPGQVTEEHREEVVHTAQEEAQRGVQDVAETGRDIEGTTDEMVRTAQEGEDVVTEAAERGRDVIDLQRDQLANLPDEVAGSITEIMDRFERQSGEGLDYMQGMAERAIGASEYGRTSAMQAATESIHGAMRDSIAQINADPNIPPTMKQQMIAQVRSQGAMKTSATIGQTAHQFAQTTANTITNSMNAVGSVLNTQTQVSGALHGAAISQVSAAHMAAAELGTQLAKMETDLAQWEGNSQLMVQNSINTARQFGIDTQLRMLDERQDARALVTDVRMLDYELAHRATSEDWNWFFQSERWELMEEMVGQGNRNAALQMLMSGAQGGLTGLIASGLGLIFTGGLGGGQ